MDRRGLGPVLAAGALLAGCGRDAPPEPRPERAVQTPAITELGAPVAPIEEPSPPASPEPSESASPSPTPAAALAAYPPRDECAGLPGFAAFRDKLFAAARARDAEALAALADPKINLDFGGGTGIDQLKTRLSDPRVRLWEEIAALSGLGCAADGGIATLPAIFSRVPDDVDAATTMLVTGTEVPLRAKPERTAEVVRPLDWALVTLASGFDPAARYTAVSASDGSRGFVLTAKLRSLLDYRLIADRQDGEWKITALIAGD